MIEWRKAAAIAATIALMTALLAISGCGSNTATEKSKESAGGESVQSAAKEPATDYADSSSWYQIPEITKDVDAFYFYPTLYNGSDEGDDDYATIDNEDVLGAIGAVYQGQASVFEDSANVFVPYYRQASMKHEMDAYMETGSLDAALESKPLEDAVAALDYYFENYNDGRPFILAGHSQGAALMKLALKTYFKDHPECYERMVAAYIIGYSVTQEDLDEHPYLKFASGEADTGVVISWNTEGPENVANNATNMVVLDGSIAINPLNWKRDETYAPSSENLGSLVTNSETGEYEISDCGADAQVNLKRGVVVTNADTEAVTDLTVLFGTQSYHKGDYSLYYMNIHDNVAKRVAAFMARK